MVCMFCRCGQGCHPQGSQGDLPQAGGQACLQHKLALQGLDSQASHHNNDTCLDAVTACTQNTHSGPSQAFFCLYVRAAEQALCHTLVLGLIHPAFGCLVATSSEDERIITGCCIVSKNAAFGPKIEFTANMLPCN